MSKHMEHKIFPEMPEQPDMSDMPIILTKPSYSWCPSKEVILLIIVSVLVLLLAVGGAYIWSRYDFCGLDQVQVGLSKVGEQFAALKMPWQ
jgi:hypothetical protein